MAGRFRPVLFTAQAADAIFRFLLLWKWHWRRKLCGHFSIRNIPQNRLYGDMRPDLRIKAG
jgi:hypothetical protein